MTKKPLDTEELSAEYLIAQISALNNHIKEANRVLADETDFMLTDGYASAGVGRKTCILLANMWLQHSKAELKKATDALKERLDDQ